MTSTENSEELDSFTITGLDGDEFGLVIKECLESEGFNKMMKNESFESVITESLLTGKTDTLYVGLVGYYVLIINVIINKLKCPYNLLKYSDNFDEYYEKYFDIIMMNLQKILLKKLYDLSDGIDGIDDINYFKFAKVLDVYVKCFKDANDILTKEEYKDIEECIKMSAFEYE